MRNKAIETVDRLNRPLMGRHDMTNAQEKPGPPETDPTKPGPPETDPTKPGPPETDEPNPGAPETDPTK